MSSSMVNKHGYIVPLFELYIVDAGVKIGRLVLEASTYHEVSNYLEDHPDLKIFTSRGNKLFLTPIIQSEQRTQYHG